MSDEQIKELIGRIYLSGCEDPHQELAEVLGVSRWVAKQLFWKVVYNTHIFNMVKGATNAD